MDVDFHNNSYYGVYSNGERSKITIEAARYFINHSDKEYIPKGYTKKDIELGHKLEDIKNVLFNYIKYSYVKLYVGRKCLVPRELSDLFEASVEGDSIDRGIDQPWNDRTVHKLDFSSIAKVVRIGAKHTARVLTHDGFEVVISKADALAFKAGEAQRGADALAKFGIVFDMKTKRKAGRD